MNISLVKILSNGTFATFKNLFFLRLKKPSSPHIKITKINIRTGKVFVQQHFWQLKS